MEYIDDALSVTSLLRIPKPPDSYHFEEVRLTRKDRMKMLSTIWTVYTLFGVLILVFGEGAGAGIVLLGLALMTLLATLVIAWSRVVDEATDNPAISAKAKRSDLALIDRLVDSMSDAELTALRKRLAANVFVSDDGEIASLEELRTSNHGYT